MILEPLTTDNLVTVASTLLGSLSVLIVARLGIRRWRHERVEARQIELAEKALALMYEAEDVFSSIRSPFSFSSEYQDRQKDQSEPDWRRQQLDLRYVTYKRNQSFQPYFQRLLDVYPVYKAVFGVAAAKPLRTVLEIRRNILIAADALADRHPIENEDSESKKFYDEQRLVVWDMKKEANPTTQELKSAISNLEAQTKPLLKTRYSME